MKRKLMVMALAVSICLASAQTIGLPPTSAQTPTPTAGADGSISGRVYVDVDADGAFAGPDAPLVFPLEIFSMDVGGPPLERIGSSPDGTYQFGNLPPGNYLISINLPIVQCAAPTAPFSWVGDTFSGFFCGNFVLTTPERTVALAAAENMTGVDFPQVPSSHDVTARVWLNASPLAANNTVAITVGGRECWSAQVSRAPTAAGVPVSFYSATLTPPADPACHGGDLDILIDGRSAGATTNWNVFWRHSLFPFGPRPLNETSDLLNSTDLALPSFLGISGQVAEAGTVTPQNVAQHQGTLVSDGTTVTAFVGTTACGSTLTESLTGPQGQFGGNLFGLIVPPASVKAGCGTPGASVTFCVGDFKARQPAAGPFSAPGPSTPVTWEAPKRADITLEPTTEPCLAAEAPPGPTPEQIPASLPSTGGPPGGAS